MATNRVQRRRMLRGVAATDPYVDTRQDMAEALTAAAAAMRNFGQAARQVSGYDSNVPLQLDPDAIAAWAAESDVFRRASQGNVQPSTVNLADPAINTTGANPNAPLVMGGRGRPVPANTAMRAFVWHGTNSRPRGETITSFATNVEDAMRTVALRELGIEPDEADMYTAEITAWIAANLRGRMNMQHSLDRGYVIYSGATTAPGRPAAGDDDDY